MWHYEFILGYIQYRFDADSFDACLTALLEERSHNPQMTAVKIFEGGTFEFGSGTIQFDAFVLAGAH